MAKTVNISLNAVISFILVFLAACGFIFYQQSVSAKLFQEYVDLKDASTSDAADLIYVRHNLGICLEASGKTWEEISK